jgi:peptide/histidine transporter 3/4
MTLLDVLFVCVFVCFLVNECLEKVASYGIMPNMILYLINDYNMAIAKATNVLYTWSAMSNILSIFGAFLSDSYLGRFNVIVIGSFSSLLVSLLLLQSFPLSAFLSMADKLFF